MVVASLHAQAPDWWVERGLVVTNAPVATNDFASANVGQLKHVASRAVEELEARLPGGAGSNVLAMVAAWTNSPATTNDYAAVNVGQLKAVAKPFYDQFAEIGILTNDFPWTTGLSNGYPWIGGSNANDFAMANIGQIKRVFAFDLAPWNSDDDHLPDAWEEAHFGAGNLAEGDSDDFDGDGISNLQEYLGGTDPSDFYNGQGPLLFVVSGDRQSAETNAFVEQALVVGVSNTLGVLTNAPVQFEVAVGDSLLGLSTNGAGLSSFITGRTDSAGQVGVWLQYGSDAFRTNEVRILAGPPSGTVQTNMLALFKRIPLVTWISPTNGSEVAIGTVAYLIASVTEEDLVSRIEFLADGTNVGSDTTVPYAIAWANSVAGVHSLQAQALFGEGATTGCAPVSVTIFDPDPDGDGSPDAWELQWFGSTTNPDAVASADPDGDGFTNGFERLELTSPLDYFNGELPEMEIVGGDMQGAPTNAFLAEALAVRLTRPSGLVYSNAPVTFSAPTGGLSETSGGTTFLSLDVRADANGIARAWYRTPAAASTNAITATATNATASTNVELTAFAGAGKPTLSVLAPDSLASEPGINRGLFQVLRAGNPWVSVTAQLGISGTASNGLDYDSLPTNLLLSAGLLTGAIEVVVRDDTNSEAPETVVLRLLTNSAYSVGSPASNTVTVADNDSGGGTAAIGAGDGFSAAIMYDGTIWTWGSDADGRLGNGDTFGSTNRPAQLQGLAGFREISCGTAHVLALASNGTVKAWGDGGSGKLGVGGTEDKQSPNDVDDLTGVIAVSAGDDHSMGLTNGGKVFCWGDNKQGQVGVGTNEDTYEQPQLTTLTSGVTRLSAGRRNSYAVQTGSLKGCGDNDRGQLARPTSGVGNIGETNRFITALGGVEDVASGREFVLARVGDKIWSWGENQDWQLGAESPTYRTNAAQVAGISNVIALAAGRNHSMALRSDGSVWCWGLGDDGRLGDGNGGDHKRATPTQATAAGFSNVIAIAAGRDHSMALDKQGWIWVWGTNGNGQLGLGSGVAATNRPTRIETLNLLSYPPSVQITSPADGLGLTNAAGRLALAATAEDPDGTVARVDFFYQGTNLIGSDTSAPFTATWTNLPVGTWTFTAKATDNKGVAATSAPVTVTILSDDDGMGDAWEQTWFGNLDQDPGGDADGDGLTNEEEQALATNPTKADTDGDLLLDKFEDLGRASGLDPLVANGIDADWDGDGLNTLQEQIANSNPSLWDTDGDGVPDGLEFNQGSNPSNPDDGGQAPPEGETVMIRAWIGDHSGSESERYYMVIRDTQPGGQMFFPQAQTAGKVEYTDLRMRAGRAYEVEIRWVDTTIQEGGPDYDYTARFDPVPGDPQRFVTDDPEDILGVHDESDEFFASGKTATLVTVLLVSDDNMAGVVGDSIPSSRGASGEKHFVSPKKTQVISDDYVILRVLGPTEAQFAACLSWEGGQAFPDDPLRRRIPRNATGKTAVSLRGSASGVEVAKMNVWVIWATGRFTHKPTGSPAGYLGGELLPWEAIDGSQTQLLQVELTHPFCSVFSIEPASICDLTSDVPALQGTSGSAPPGGTHPVLGTSLAEGVAMKWDSSRRFSERLLNPTLIPREKFPSGFGILFDAQPQASHTPIPFPAEDITGNDDASCIDEDDDPYHVKNDALKGHAIGEISMVDLPSTGMTVGGISEGATYQDEMLFEDFARVELGERWYRLSDPLPWKFLWRIRFESGLWRDDGSVAQEGH